MRHDILKLFYGLFVFFLECYFVSVANEIKMKDIFLSCLIYAENRPTNVKTVALILRHTSCTFISGVYKVTEAMCSFGIISNIIS